MNTAAELRVLVLPATAADGVAMSKVFAANGLTCEVTRSIVQLSEMMRVGVGVSIVAEEALLGDASALLATIADQQVWSDIPIIVLSRPGREVASLAKTLAKLGNVSVVEKPIRTSTLLSLVRSNLRARDRQYQVREHLKEQAQAQKAIREGERRYRAVIENIADYAIFMTDAEGRISSWNEGAQAILGYASEDVMGRSVETFSTEEDLATQVTQKELDAARGAGRHSSVRWRIRKGGESLFVEGVCVSVPDEGGQIVGFAFFLKDVTERYRNEMQREQLLDSERAARTEAERASRMKDEFLATLGHELRTPLNAILGWTQVLRRVAPPSADVANGLTVIERNARAQAQIIEDLLDMSGIISGKVRLKMQSLELTSVVSAAVESIRPAAQAKEIQLQVDIDPCESPVRGDPNRLQQVFWNLLTNAVKFTPKGGRVTVSVVRVNSRIDIKVSDSGEGIAPSFLPFVFDRFRQADASSTRRHGGLGLGLSIVKQLVELHGGTISAASRGIGAGSMFHVCLPIMAIREEMPIRSYPAASRPPSSIPVGEDEPSIDLHGVRVLVVDDEQDARSLIQRLLQESNASVTTAQSAAEALDLLSNELPDVLVSDIGMPGEDGYMLIHRIRTSPDKSSEIPAIALTAYARSDDRLKAIRAGFQHHIAKPVEPTELIETIANLARASAATRTAANSSRLS